MPPLRDMTIKTMAISARAPDPIAKTSKDMPDPFFVPDQIKPKGSKIVTVAAALTQRERNFQHMQIVLKINFHLGVELLRKGRD